MPEGFRPIVVDNGSRDDTAAVARSLGATVVDEPRPGYGAAVHAGLEAATADFVAVIDGDGSMDPAELVAAARGGHQRTADLAVGRRRPSRLAGVWPWHARAGNAVVLWWLRRRIGMPLHDIAPMRVVAPTGRCSTSVSRTVASATRSSCCSGRRVAQWRFVERDIAYHPRAGGHEVQGVRLGARHHPGHARLRPGARMRPAVALVVAKSPVAGRVKTRLGQEVGMERAADLAAAALLDTVAACAAAYGAERCHLALDGVLAHGRLADELLDAVGRLDGPSPARRRPSPSGWCTRTRTPPRSPVHPWSRSAWTPHSSRPQPSSRPSALLTAPDAAVLGPAYDGGWWLLGVGRTPPARPPRPGAHVHAGHR